ncbi:MAG TPA: YciI family protein [Solirubrobacteraceae bacterium]|nr:YciI family protein [Solirubrobacteraceae bacterium]
MQYMFLLFIDENAAANASEAESAEVYKAYGAFTEAVNSAGVFKAGDPLQSTSTATVVRAPNGGSPLTTDGPYAESKEQLGGYYILDCKNLDEAIEWAAKIPAAHHGAVEIRPIMAM